MKVLVLGATGYVGAKIAIDLADAGRRVTLGVRRDSQSGLTERLLHPKLAAFPVAEIDLFDPSLLVKAMEDTEVVVMATGLRAGIYSNDHYRWTYVAGIENVIAAAKLSGVRRIILISGTDSTLTKGHRVHWDEEREAAPLNVRTKAMKLAEDLATTLSDAVTDIAVLKPAWLWSEDDPVLRERLDYEVKMCGALQLAGMADQFFAATHIQNLLFAVRQTLLSPHIGGHSYYVTDEELVTSFEFFTSLSRALGFPLPQRPSALTAWARQKKPVLRQNPMFFSDEEWTHRLFGSSFSVQKAIRDFGYRTAVSQEVGFRNLKEADPANRALWQRQRLSNHTLFDPTALSPDQAKRFAR